MREPEMAGSRITISSPKAGTMLSRYVSAISRKLAFDLDWFGEASDDERSIIIQNEMASALNIGELPRAVVQEHFVVRPLVELGMPTTGVVAPWQKSLLDGATSTFLHRNGRTSLRGDRRHSADKSVARMVILGAYADALASAKTDNQAYEMVAERLGGCDRDHVRRVIRRFRRGLGRSPEEMVRLNMLALIRISAFLAQADQDCASRISDTSLLSRNREAHSVPRTE